MSIQNKLLTLLLLTSFVVAKAQHAQPARVSSTTNMDGVGRLASFGGPQGIAIGRTGLVYVADTHSNRIRQISPDGHVTTIAGGAEGNADGVGTAASFRGPTGIAVAPDGTLYIADQGNHTIRKITAQGVVTTLAGRAREARFADGIGSTARFQDPTGIAVGPTGTVYVVGGPPLVRKIDPVTGRVTTLAPLSGTEQATDQGAQEEVRHRNFKGVAVTSTGTIYLADEGNATIRQLTPTGHLSVLAGTVRMDGYADGASLQAYFKSPVALALAPSGTLYIADESNQLIRFLTSTGEVHTLAGASGQRGSADGRGAAARFYQPRGVAIGPAGQVYVADSFNNCIRLITPAGVVSTLAGTAPVSAPVGPGLPPLPATGDKIYTFVEKMPVLPGGEADRSAAGSEHTLAEAVKRLTVVPAGTPAGIVYVQFVVLPTGKINDAKVLKGLTPPADATVLAAIKQLPTLVPGVQNGRLVAVKFTLAVRLITP